MPLLMALLSLASTPLPEDEWVAAAVAEHNFSVADAKDLLQALVGQGVLQVEVPDDSRRHWARQGWAAAHDYHWHTRGIPKPDWTTRAGLEADMAKMRQFVDAETPPSNYLDRTEASTRRQTLGRPAPQSEPASSATWSDTLHTPDPGRRLGIEELSYLLHMSFGQLRSRRLPVTGDHVAKTSPSGGSRHPTEAHVLACRVDGLAPGTYHYSVRDHALDLVHDEDPSEFLQRDVVMLRGRVSFVPKAAILLTSTVERSMFRYRDSRSYRVLFLDLGHLMQTFALVATALERSSYRGYTVRSAAVASHLDLDPLMHLPIGYGLLS